MLHLQVIRRTFQFIFLALLILGLELFEYPFINPLIAIATLLVGAYYCGWVCPFGSLQEWSGHIGVKIVKKKWIPPKKADLTFSLLRYLPLFFTIVWLDDTLNARRTLIKLSLGIDPLNISLYALFIFLCFSLIIDRPFCRWLCPRGGSFGVLSFARVFTIRRNLKNCISCKKCD